MASSGYQFTAVGGHQQRGPRRTVDGIAEAFQAVLGGDEPVCSSFAPLQCLGTEESLLLRFPPRYGSGQDGLSSPFMGTESTSPSPTAFPPRHGHGQQRPSNDGKGKVVYLWFCCYCGVGPWDYSRYDGCTACCNHTRCPGCRVERHTT